MVRSFSLIATVIVLGLTGTAAAGTPLVTVPSLQTQTKTVFNRRLVFTNAPLTISSVRCQRDTATTFFCVGKLRWTDGTLTTPPALMWNVTVDSHGVIHWARAR